MSFCPGGPFGELLQRREEERGRMCQKVICQPSYQLWGEIVYIILEETVLIILLPPGNNFCELK